MSSSNYGATHRKFLQGMMCRKQCTVAEMERLYVMCAATQNAAQNAVRVLPDLVRTINKKIEPFHMEIREGLDEENGSRHYVLVNCQEGALSLQAAQFSSTELEFFRNLISAVVHSDVGHVSSIEALNLSSDLTKQLSKSDAQDLLDRLHQNKRISMQEGRIRLSVLTIVEFKQYLKTMYPNHTKTCPLCKQLVLWGKVCTSCSIKLHFHCVKRLLKDTTNSSCPQCRSDLTAAPDNDEDSPVAGPSTRKRRR